MTDYTLQCFVESGNAYKVGLMLELSGADWQPQWVDFMNGATRTPEFRSQNSMGEVPVLIDHRENDLVLTQSGLILWHLADRFETYAAQNATEHREVLRWLFWDNHKLTGYTATYRFMAKFMGKGDSPEGQFMQARLLSAFKLLNAHLADRDWIAADHATIADISCCGYLFWPGHFGVTWDDYPNIASWLDRIAALPNYKPAEDIIPSGPAEA